MEDFDDFLVSRKTSASSDIAFKKQRSSSNNGYAGSTANGSSNPDKDEDKLPKEHRLKLWENLNFQKENNRSIEDYKSSVKREFLEFQKQIEI